VNGYVLYCSAGRSEAGNRAFFKAIKDSGRYVAATGLRITDDMNAELEVGPDRSRADALYDFSAWQMTVPSRFKLFKVVGLDDSFLPLKPVIVSARSLGHIKATPDHDGVHRRIPLFIRLVDRYIPALCMATLTSYWNLKPGDFSLSRDGYVEIKRKGQVLKIPVDSHGMMPVNWGKIWDVDKDYSVVDVLSDEPDTARESRYKDKIVIVGVTGTGTTDFGVTPVEVTTPLSRIHSHTLSTILMKNFITEIPAFPYIVVFSVLLGILFALGATRIRLKIGIVAAVVICVSALVLSFVIFIVWSCEAPIIEFLVIFTPAASIALAGRAGSIELQALRSSRALERYLSPELLTSIVESGSDLDLTTKRSELTVVFVDIEGFSTISETVQVEYINNFLNDFFERMTLAIFEYQGTVDKFLGDGILAFFGDPVPIENHAMAAVKASLEMQDQMAELNAQWAHSGIPDFEKGVRIRIGINTGLIIVGNIGSSRRLEYTVLGSAVNIASRLQSLAPPGGIIMTSRTSGLVREEIPCEGPDYVKVKGIDRDIEVYRIFPET